MAQKIEFAPLRPFRNQSIFVLVTGMPSLLEWPKDGEGNCDVLGLIIGRIELLGGVGFNFNLIYFLRIGCRIIALD